MWSGRAEITAVCMCVRWRKGETEVPEDPRPTERAGCERGLTPWSPPERARTHTHRSVARAAAGLVGPVRARGVFTERKTSTQYMRVTALNTEFNIHTRAIKRVIIHTDQIEHRPNAKTRANYSQITQRGVKKTTSEYTVMRGTELHYNTLFTQLG